MVVRSVQAVWRSCDSVPGRWLIDRSEPDQEFGRLPLPLFGLAVFVLMYRTPSMSWTKTFAPNCQCFSAASEEIEAQVLPASRLAATDGRNS